MRAVAPCNAGQGIGQTGTWKCLIVSFANPDLCKVEAARLHASQATETPTFAGPEVRALAWRIQHPNRISSTTNNDKRNAAGCAGKWFGVWGFAKELRWRTDHHLGLFRVLPYSFHLAVDGLVGLAFVTAQVVLGFTGLAFWYYMVLGVTVLAVVGLHQPDEGSTPA